MTIQPQVMFKLIFSSLHTSRLRDVASVAIQSNVLVILYFYYLHSGSPRRYTPRDDVFYCFATAHSTLAIAVFFIPYGLGSGVDLFCTVTGV